jgi:hypothetical protein
MKNVVQNKRSRAQAEIETQSHKENRYAHFVNSNAILVYLGADYGFDLSVSLLRAIDHVVKIKGEYQLFALTAYTSEYMD